jgi:uncharacterized protein (DUF433 family)
MMVAEKRMKHPRISFDSDDTAVIRDTNITVEEVLTKLVTGSRVEDILIAHPGLVPDDIFAAVIFAADSVAARQSR